MDTAQTMFDPAQYRNVRRPLLEAESLPAWCYRSPQFFEREIDRIFMRCWNFVGRVDEIPNPGDYLVFEIAGQSLIVIRDRKREIHAFANTCRHRGTQLLSGKGNCPAITCPYHSWAYSLSGELVATPGMDEARDFNKKQWGLLSIKLEVWGGFMFVNFDGAARPLVEYLGDFAEKFASYRFEDMALVRRKDYELECNWKIYVENAMEDYHTPTVHMASIGEQRTERENAHGEWEAIHMEEPDTIAILPEDTTTFPHISSLSGRPASGTYFALIYPTTFFATTKDCMWFLQTVPLGPTKMKLSVGSCFPRTTIARSDFADVVQRYYKRWDKSVPEDNAIAVLQQAGLRSSLSKPGRLSIREPIVHSIAIWVLNQVLEEKVPA